MLRTALAVCVPIAGFVIGRGVSASSAKPEAAVPAGKSAAAPRGEDLPGLLCEISVGNLTEARKRIAELREVEGSDSELGKLLTAIAMKDGASFDALIDTIPEPRRSDLIEICVAALSAEPAAFLRLLAESEGFSKAAFGRDLGRLVDAIRSEPDLFLDQLEQGRLTWPAPTLQMVVSQLQPDPTTALRLLDLYRSGQFQVSGDYVLVRIIERLDEAGLEKLRSVPGEGPLGGLAEQEAKARALFANFDLSGKSWNGIDESRIVAGIGDLISRSGVPDIDWSGVPENLRNVLPGSMVQTAVRFQGDAGARTLLDSIKNSELPAETRNQMLESAASALFDQQGNIRLAIDYAHAITNDADGRNAGEDLLIKWMAFDPVSARGFTDKIGPSAYRDRILDRVREISP